MSTLEAVMSYFEIDDEFGECFREETNPLKLDRKDLPYAW